MNISIQRVIVTNWGFAPWLADGLYLGFPLVLIYGPAASGKTSLLNFMYHTYMQTSIPSRLDGTPVPEVTLTIQDAREAAPKTISLKSGATSPSARRFLPPAIRLGEVRGPTRSKDYSLSGQRIAEVEEYCEHHKYQPRILFLDMPDIGLDDDRAEKMAQRLSEKAHADQMFVTTSRKAFADAWRGFIVRLRPS